MKRSVIQLAGKTHVISLPSKWVKKYNIKKGDELEISEENENIIISKEKAKTELKKDIDVSNYGLMARRVVGALYKKGYDEVKFFYEEPKIGEILQKEIDSGLIGFEIISHGKNHCIVRMVASQENENFDSLFRRIFFVLISEGKDGIDFLLPLDKENLKGIISRDKTINKLADYCRRVINKSKDENSTYIYHIIEELEKIGDVYRDMFKFVLENDVKLNKAIIEEIKNVNSYFELLHNLYYNYSPKDVSNFYNERVKLINNIKKIMNKANEDETVVLMHLSSIVQRVYDLNGVILQIRL